jgi:hypothetical protein
MSAEVSGWVWKNAPVKSGELVVLLALADNAHDDGGGAYPKQATLAEKSRMSSRQVRNCLKSLEAKGLIEPQGTTQGGVTVWRIRMEEDFSGRKSASGEGGSPLPTEPSLEPSTVHITTQGVSERPRTTSLSATDQERVGRGRKTADPDELPADFPAHLLPALGEVYETLNGAASARGARPAARAAIARAMVKRPLKPHAAVAERVAHWLLYGNGQRASCRDVVARWRDWCDGEADVQPGAATVHPIRNGGTRFQQAQASLAALHAQQLAEESVA